MTAAGAGAAAIAARDCPSKVVLPSLAGLPLVDGLMEAAPALAASGERGLAGQRGKRRMKGMRANMLDSEYDFMIRLELVV
jgi:hypothetical protein